MAKHIIRFQEKANPSLTLFCFPYAGAGGGVFRLWGSLLPPEIELYAMEYPGRVFLRDEPAKDMKGLLDIIYPEILPLLDKPFAFFGHSYGSVVAFALAKRLQQDGKQMPFHLFASSRRAPHCPREKPLIGHLSDEAFVKAIQMQYGAIPEAVLNDKDLLKLFLPVLKGDIKINEEYLGDINPPFTLPVTVYYGNADKSCDSPSLDKWRDVTTGRFSIESFAGGHFFIDAGREELLKGIVSGLQR